MKKFLIMIMAILIAMAMTLTACGTASQGDSEEQTAPENSEEENTTEQDIPFLWHWVFLQDSGVAFMVPEDLKMTEIEGKKGSYRGTNDQFIITVTRWDRLSYPDIDDLAALVKARTKKPVTVVDHETIQLVKAGDLESKIRLFFMDQDGDDYILTIEKNTEADPEMTIQELESVASSIEDSVKRYDSFPNGTVITVLPPTEFPEPDYLVLVNSSHPVPEDWDDSLDLVRDVNTRGNEIRAERKTYKEYLKLKKDLETNDGILIDVDFGLRTPEEQQALIDEYTEMYGAAYANRIASKPGYSEHHTGLALDVYLIIDGKNVYLNEEMEKYPEIWAKIHSKLAGYGFILRYPKGSSYPYEPWHIRYVGKDHAEAIMAEPGLLLETYLKRS